jgi:DnaJ homolog subfamily C member 28
MPNVEDHLRKAIEEGKFDDLPGKGKPLRLEDFNPYADPEWELAYHMLKENGYSLPWIENRQNIEKDIGKARKELQRAWKWRIIYLSCEVPDEKASEEWNDACAAFKEKIPSINKRIRDYNLQVPNVRFQRTVLNFETEINKITGK